MLKLNEFSHNHHLSRVKMLAKYIRRGISVPISDLQTPDNRSPKTCLTRCSSAIRNGAPFQ